MIDVLIVDDEPMIIEILRKEVNWKKYNMRVVGYAHDGFAAIDFLKKHEVDIIFTDIKMPHMGGLELIERLHEFLPNLLFVAISSYSDFNLVRQSFQNGIVDYILKIDIDNPKILDVLLSKLKLQVEQCSKARGMQHPTDQLLQKINHNEDYLEHCVYRMLTITLEDHVKTIFVSELLFILRENADHFVFGFFDWKIIILCFGEDAEQVSEICDFLVKRIHGNADESQLLIVGASRILEYKDRNRLYDQAEQSLYGCFYRQNEHFFEYRGASGRQYQIANKALFEMSAEFLKSVSLQEFMTAMEYLFSVIAEEQIAPDTMKENFVNLFRELNRRLEKRFGAVMAEEQMGLYDVILSAPNYEELKELCCNELYAWSLKLNQQMNIPLSDAIQAYIRMHYKNQDLTIQDVADELRVSPRRISNCFANEMNTHFKDYLNRIRIEKAKELLANSAMRINEAAICVGYANVEHFSRLFTKSVGESPISYMKNSRRKHI